MPCSTNAYTAVCHLNAGDNRIVVQLGVDDLTTQYFMVRITDQNHVPITPLTASASPKKYRSNKATTIPSVVPHFAEAFFQDKIEADSTNIVNYLLLSKAYLRSLKLFEARKVLEQGMKLYQNSILKLALGICYIKENNRVGTSEITEYFKDEEPRSLITYDLKISDLKEERKYQELQDTVLAKIKLFGESESTYEDLIFATAQLNDVPKLLGMIDDAHRKYPNHDMFAQYVYTVEKKLKKNPTIAMNFLESYLDRHFDAGLTSLLVTDLFQAGMTRKAYNLLKEKIELWPYDPDVRLTLVKEYFAQQKYQEAYDEILITLKQMPYSGYIYNERAGIEEALGRSSDAISSYNMALRFDPNLYESRDKLRNLLKKKNLFQAVEKYKIQDLIKNTGKQIETANFDYYYLQDESNVFIYPEGGREEVRTIAIKVLNQRAIDRYKESSLPRSGYEQLTIEEALLFKANGKKSNPEVNENEVVWTGLEVNDIIYVKFKLRSYLFGKFAKEYYKSHLVMSDVPTEIMRHTVMMPKNISLIYRTVNGNLEPKITESEDGKLYEWETFAKETIKDEPYMPMYADIGLGINLTTVKSWNEIAEWYRDLVYSKVAYKDDYEVQEVFKEIFAGKKNLTAEQKAKLIYDYITKNISYSSVAFRQSEIIPQKASKTLNTRLGDCKDISTLFVSLANLCNLKANLVLVSTRENGLKAMDLPSFDFNHCIVKYSDENQRETYLELTDRDLPFRSLPSALFQARALIIPMKDESAPKSELFTLVAASKIQDKIKSSVKVEIVGTEMRIHRNNTRFGHLVSNTRDNYKAKNQDKLMKEMQEELSRKHSNPIKLNQIKIKGLEELLDSVELVTDYSITNEVKKVGAQYAFSVPFPEDIFTANAITAIERTYDFEYWNYENVDEYDSTVEIDIPKERAFVDIPANQVYKFNNINYSITFSKPAPNKLLISRKADIDRRNIKAADYQQFKTFVSQILEVEGALITYK